MISKHNRIGAFNEGDKVMTKVAQGFQFRQRQDCLPLAAHCLLSYLGKSRNIDDSYFV